MSKRYKIADIRRQYGTLQLNDDDVLDCPIEQFQSWFDEAVLSEAVDPNAMVLSTVDKAGVPDARIVLLKGIVSHQFIFYTNYLSSKGDQLKDNPKVALTFYWPNFARQIRIRGECSRVTTQESDDYFYSRPIESQRSAIISPQSQEIKARSVLIEAHQTLALQDAPPMRPDDWGGYQVKPFEMEFFQGRNDRLHDRIRYRCKNGTWVHARLAP